VGELQIGVGLVPIRQVQLPGALGFGTNHRIQAGVLTGPGQLHIQPVDVFCSGEPDQGPAAGQPLGAVAGGGIGQVHPAIALSPTAAIQIPPWQSDLPAVAPVQADG
jgi:hypothetical protein